MNIRNCRLFTGMAFGLANAPASFQGSMNAIFNGLKGFNLQVFIYDVCVAIDTWGEHLEMLEKVFQLVIKSGHTLQPARLLFGADRIIFLGHEISKNGIRQNPYKLKVLLDLQ